jgi:hypothetical protein
MSTNARRADGERLNEALENLIRCAATKHEVEKHLSLSYQIEEQKSWLDIQGTLSTVDLVKLARRINPEEDKIAYNIIWSEICIKSGKLTSEDWKELYEIVDRYRKDDRQFLVNIYLRIIWEHASANVRLVKWFVQKCIDDPIEGDISSPADDTSAIVNSKEIMEKYIKSYIEPEQNDGQYSDKQKQWIIHNGSVADLRALIKSLTSKDAAWFSKLLDYYNNGSENRPGGYIPLNVHEYSSSRRTQLKLKSLS